MPKHQKMHHFLKSSACKKIVHSMKCHCSCIPSSCFGNRILRSFPTWEIWLRDWASAHLRWRSTDMQIRHVSNNLHWTRRTCSWAKKGYNMLRWYTIQLWSLLSILLHVYIGKSKTYRIAEQTNTRSPSRNSRNGTPNSCQNMSKHFNFTPIKSSKWDRR